MANVQTYVRSFQDIVLTINGIRIEGFADGDDAVSIEPVEDSATAVIGADGVSTVSYMVSNAVNVMVKLQSTSPSAAILERILLLSKNGVIPDGVPVVYRDARKKTGGACPNAHIMTKPTRAEGKGAGDLEFTIFCGSWGEAENFAI